MSIHRVDPRFVLSHKVGRAVVFDGLESWRTGLASAGIEVSRNTSGGEPPDLVVTPARLAAAAARLGARSIIVEGTVDRALAGDYRAQRLLVRPTRERPTLALPLDQPAPTSYALDRWSVVDRRWKTARMRVARALVSRGAFPSWGSPIVTVASKEAGHPRVVAAAHRFGVPPDAGWFLTFGQGDSLSRNAFQLFRRTSSHPSWVLKFARVPGYSERFDNDERGLQLARAAGVPIEAHAPRFLGRFDVDGIHASLETAAVGKRLRDLLRTPGERTAKLSLVERIGDWIIDLGRCTQTPPETLAAERQRLDDDVLPSWRRLGVDARLINELPPLAAVTQHNDLGTWNVVTHDGDFVVVDWENVRETALPLWDLLYFLADAFVHLDRPADSPEHLPERITRLFAGEAPSSTRLFSLVRRGAEAAAVPPGAVGAVATLCWLSHSLSASAHNRDIAAFTPGDPPRIHGLEGIAEAWMKHPALGVGWSVWRA
jgi:Phosphotransferase enzyme family